jgi:hypothetical protein
LTSAYAAGSEEALAALLVTCVSRAVDSGPHESKSELRAVKTPVLKPFPG